MASILGPLRVSAAAERLYRRVLRSGPAELAEHAANLGWSSAEADEALSNLLDRGLVREAPSGFIEADDPRLVIGRLVDRARDDLDEATRSLEVARSGIVEFVVDHQHGQGATRRPIWEVVPADLGAGLVAQALASSTGIVRSSVASMDYSPDGLEQVLELQGQQIRSGRANKVLYPLSIIEDPEQREWMRRFADNGEQQRLSARPLSEFVVFGNDIVIAVADWGDAHADYVQIRDTMLVTAFRQLFDITWDNALPVPDRGPDIDDDVQVLRLLAAGQKDEAIARHLGVSLRTVRRRIAYLMDDLGASTRFQLGVAVQRRGMLDGGVG